MYEITVPTLNSNDASYVLTAWHYADGEAVPAGAEIAVVETSKAAEELTSEGGGVLQHRVAEAQECRPGEVIGRLFPDEQQRLRFLAADTGPRPSSPVTQLVITEPARLLIDRYGVDAAALDAIGKTVIGRADVQKLIDRSAVAETPAPAGPRRIHRLTRSQLAVAEVVTTSHRTIPAAYAAVLMNVDDALEVLRAYSENARRPARLPELLIRGVAGLIDRFPLFFASALDDGTAALADEARIAVTIDVGRGLYLPVVDAAAAKSLPGIADSLAAYRGKARQEQFTAADLADATIGVSLPAGDVLFVQPIVPPGLSCMVALGATHTLPYPDGLRRVAYLGLSYDHRLINGRDAAQFLGALKSAVESPEQLRALTR